MALRIATKINRKAVQNIYKSLWTSSPELSVANPPQRAMSAITYEQTIKTSTPTTPLDTEPTTIEDQATTIPITTPKSHRANMKLSAGAYQVCKPRSQSAHVQYNASAKVLIDGNVDVKNEVDLLKKRSKEEQLQPSKLPEYYQAVSCADSVRQLDADVAGKVEDAAKEAEGLKVDGDVNGGYRKFQESMTYRNLTQPIKSSRMANPFPDPIKEMPSYKVSDQEKSAQMLAEARSDAMAQAHFNTINNRQPQVGRGGAKQMPPFTVAGAGGVVRHYSTGAGASVSTDSKKCKKLKGKGKTCTKLRLTNCKQHSQNTSCQDNTYVHKECEKKEAPYPSYSETCHEDRTKNCRTCPWVDAHRVFKSRGTKMGTQQFHTMSGGAVGVGVLGKMPTLEESTTRPSSNRSMNMSTQNMATANPSSITSADSYESIDSIPDTMELKRKKPDCQPIPGARKEPCAWVDEEGGNARTLKNRLKQKQKQQEQQHHKKGEGKGRGADHMVGDDGIVAEQHPGAISATRRADAIMAQIAEQLRELALDPKKKKPCTQNIIQKCPPSTTDKDDPKKKKSPQTPSTQQKKNQQQLHTSEDAQEAHQVLTKTINSIPREAVAMPVGQSIDSWLAGLHPNKEAALCHLVEAATGGKCKKFPFKKMDFDLHKNRVPKVRGDHCPPKKVNHHGIIDCPDLMKKRDCKLETAGLLLSDSADKGEGGVVSDGKSKRICPKVDIGICKKPGDDDDDPCKRKQKGDSQICPSDLLEQRRKGRGKGHKPKTKAMRESHEVFPMLNPQTKYQPNMFKIHHIVRP